MKQWIVTFIGMLVLFLLCSCFFEQIIKHYHGWLPICLFPKRHYELSTQPLVSEAPPMTLLILTVTSWLLAVEV